MFLVPAYTEPRFPISHIPPLRLRAKIIAKVNRLPDPDDVISKLVGPEKSIYTVLDIPHTRDELVELTGYGRTAVCCALGTLKNKCLVENIVDSINGTTTWRRTA